MKSMKINHILLVVSFVIIISGCQNENITSAGINDKLEEAKRFERQKVMEEYWIDHTTSKNLPRTSKINDEYINYPTGTYHNVIFAPRFTNNILLNEPER